MYFVQFFPLDPLCGHTLLLTPEYLLICTFVEPFVCQTMTKLFPLKEIELQTCFKDPWFRVDVGLFKFIVGSLQKVQIVMRTLKCCVNEIIDKLLKVKSGSTSGKSG